MLTYPRPFVSTTLQQANGNISKAAERVGLTRVAFQLIMRKLEIERMGIRISSIHSFQKRFHLRQQHRIHNHRDVFLDRCLRFLRASHTAVRDTKAEMYDRNIR